MNLNPITVVLVFIIIMLSYLTYKKSNEPDIPEHVKNFTIKQNKQNKQTTSESTTNKKIESAINKMAKKTKKKVQFNIPDNKKTKETNCNKVFFDIGSDDNYYGKIIIELFTDVVPKTSKNFRVLCQKKKYYNSPFHRIIQNFMIQGGDYTNGNGTGGVSIYGHKFPDENFDIPHDRPYLLSMANSGSNSNGSQFFITTDATPHLDGKHVVFGEVIKGFEVVDKLNDIDVDGKDKPLENIKILNCGCYS